MAQVRSATQNPWPTGQISDRALAQPSPKISAHYVDKRVFLSDVEVLCNDLSRGERIRIWQLVKLCLLGPPKKIWGLWVNILYVAQGAQIPQNGPPRPHRGGWPPDPKFFLGSLGVPNRHNFTH